MKESFHPVGTNFERLFQHVSTGDDMCIPAATKCRREVCSGENRIYQYLHHLAVVGTNIVAEMLGTKVLQEINLKTG